MKTFMLFILLLVMGATIQAQDQHLYTIPNNGDCETHVTIAAASDITVIVNDAGPYPVTAGSTFEAQMPADTESYVTIQGEMDYTIDSSLACPVPAQDDYPALEAEMFKRMGWGKEEIEWFRNIYTPMYGNPREYIEGAAEGYKILDAAAQASAAPDPTENPAPIGTQEP